MARPHVKIKEAPFSKLEPQRMGGTTILPSTIDILVPKTCASIFTPGTARSLPQLGRQSLPADREDDRDKS